VTRREITPQGLRALTEAHGLTDQLRAARACTDRLAAARRAAVMRAHDGGLSYGAIASELGISRDNVQQLVNAARAEKDRR